MSSASAPLPPPLPRRFPVVDRLRHLFAWGVAVSIGLHLAFAPLLGLYKPAQAEQPEVERFSVSRHIKVVVPTPPPPTPTPPPEKSSPRPAPASKVAPRPALKLNVVHTTAKNGDSSEGERGYVAPSQGSENGEPGGTAASAPPAAATAAPTAEPATPAPPTPTPRPACAIPNADARVVDKVSPEYPDSARMNGAVGEVDVKVSLSPTGAILHASVYKSSGNAALDFAALAAAKASSYAPEVAECRNVGGDYLFHAEFTE
jgi:TonB family protein